MRILVGLAEPLPPFASGGSQKVAIEVAALLNQGGDAAAVAGCFSPRRRSGFPTAIRAVWKNQLYYREVQAVPRYHYFRSIKGFLQIIQSFSPDVIILHTMSAMPLAELVCAYKIPLVLYWHDVEFHKLCGYPPDGAIHIANSAFTAERVGQRFGLAPVVVPPLFTRLTRIDGQRGSRDRLLFVNPVRDKGLDRVIEIARAMPDIKIEMVESWVMSPAEREALMARLVALPNITLTARQLDMGPVYERAWLLLAPSTWEEAWGRVVSEAQSYGVPVLASKIGGLPESVGPGGILFSPSSNTESWTDQIRRLSTDSAAYNALVCETERASRRQLVEPDRNIALIRSAVHSAIETKTHR